MAFTRSLVLPLLVWLGASACSKSSTDEGPTPASPAAAGSSNAAGGDAGTGGQSGQGGQAAGGASGGQAGSSSPLAGASTGGAGGDATPLTQVTYVVDTESVLTNPERGFYHHLEARSGSFSALSTSQLQGFRTDESISLALRIYYLEDFLDAPLSASFLANVAADFELARAAGTKLVLRFAYNSSEAGTDATPERVLAHVEQLAPVLSANADVIATMQAGFIGAWGEWYYTPHFGNAGNVSATDLANRKAVVDALLQALPKTRTVQLRTPTFKRRLYGNAALDATTAFGDSPAARLGHHNDAFVADETDMGTYSDLAMEVPYLAQDSAFVPVGGENNQYLPPRTACPSALAEMEKLHVSYMNTDYLKATIDAWKDDGCYLTMQRRLGYRLALASASLPRTAKKEGSASVSLSLRNDGFAAPYNPRAVELLLKAASGTVYRRPLLADPRTWQPGNDIQMAEAVALTGVPAGTYELLLALPDPTPSLHDRSEFAIRLANEGLWDEALGAHRLNAELTITAN